MLTSNVNKSRDKGAMVMVLMSMAIVKGSQKIDDLKIIYEVSIGKFGPQG